MNPGTYNINIRQGDTCAEVIIITNPDPSDCSGHTPGTRVDLTGCVAEMQIVALYNTAPVYSLSSTAPTPNGGIILLGGTAGTVTIKIPATDTVNLNNGQYDLKIKFPDDTILTFVAGSIFVEQEVTTWTP
jgi:hypothetical protein